MKNFYLLSICTLATLMSLPYATAENKVIHPGSILDKEIDLQIKSIEFLSDSLIKFDTIMSFITDEPKPCNLLLEQDFLSESNLLDFKVKLNDIDVDYASVEQFAKLLNSDTNLVNFDSPKFTFFETCNHIFNFPNEVQDDLDFRCERGGAIEYSMGTNSYIISNNFISNNCKYEISADGLNVEDNIKGGMFKKHYSTGFIALRQSKPFIIKLGLQKILKLLIIT